MNRNCREELQDVPLSFMFASTILLKCMQEAGIEDMVIAKSLPLKVENRMRNAVQENNIKRSHEVATAPS